MKEKQATYSKLEGGLNLTEGGLSPPSPLVTALVDYLMKN